MNLDQTLLRRQAKEQAHRFLTEEAEYRMGYLEAEQPNPMTRRLSSVCAASARDGAELLLRVDAEMAERAAAVLAGDEFAQFAEAVRFTIRNGGRVIFSGCGSSGRLSMRLEQSWRTAMARLVKRYPAHREMLGSRLESVGSIMTGGEYAVIRAVESFEDSTAVGKAQAAEWKLGKGDLLVGVTATGETTSILGSAVQALSDGASVYMLICADPAPLIAKMERARAVYLHPGCRTLSLPCGPFALTGSSRMQSSTFEQFCGAVALEGALHDLLTACGIEDAFPGYAALGEAFVQTVQALLGEASLLQLADAMQTEQAVYERGGLLTMFADEFMLDVLTDTTERPPTFNTPPFRSLDMTEGDPSWAFVKNPFYDTEEAWRRCFAREVRCIEWEKSRYETLGFTPRQMEKLKPIGRAALMRFPIGKEPLPEREGAESHAMWVDAHPAPDAFRAQSRRYSTCSELTLDGAGIHPMPTHMDLFEHLAMKLMLNTLSTGVMARMGRIHGNWMTCLAMSNKKLVDRSARIVADVCGVPYETALEEVYYSEAVCEASGIVHSPAQEAIRRLGMRET